jgi:hypothetical protein
MLFNSGQRRRRFALAVALLITGCGPTVDKNGLHIIDARVHVKMAVTNRLKDPDSAKFVGFLDFDKVSDNTFKTSGLVDAKNSFGATIRTKFTATVDILGNVQSLSIEE